MDQILDPYMQKIDKYWHEITGMYMAFEKKKPIIEFDPNRIRIIAYPAKEYLDNLSDRTKSHAKKQYREASSTGAIMLFVRDEQKEILRSYIFPKSDAE
jgi:uncharacterized protein (DUF1330 family)